MMSRLRQEISSPFLSCWNLTIILLSFLGARSRVRCQHKIIKTLRNRYAGVTVPGSASLNLGSGSLAFQKYFHVKTTAKNSQYNLGSFTFTFGKTSCGISVQEFDYNNIFMRVTDERILNMRWSFIYLFAI